MLTDKAKETEKYESGDKNEPRVSFLKKVNLAKITYDYADEAKDAKPKAERLSAINDLIQLLNDQRTVTQLFIPNIESVMDMIKKKYFPSPPKCQ